MLGWTLIGLGLAVTIRAFLRSHDLLAPLRWRPVILVPLAIIGFAMVLNITGVTASVLTPVALPAGAGTPRSVWETAATAVLMLFVCVAIPRTDREGLA